MFTQQDTSERAAAYSFFGMNNMPPGIRNLINQHQPNFFGIKTGASGNYRYQERSFDLYEIVAALGVVTAAQDPFGNPCKVC